jgi:preprotein translocase subunit SecA
MTSTVKTEEAEFLKMFKVPVVEVPTNLPRGSNLWDHKLLETPRALYMDDVGNCLVMA